MEPNLGKISILLVVAVFTVSAQCVAACSVLPCNDLSESHQPVPPGDCHHKTQQGDSHEHNTICGRQVFLSEVGPQSSSIGLDNAVFDVIAIDVVERIPETLVILNPDSDHSPPPPSDLSGSTILRV